MNIHKLTSAHVCVCVSSVSTEGGTTECSSSEVTELPHHHAAVSVWQISHAELNPDPNMELFSSVLIRGMKGSIVLITQDCAHLAP